MDITCRHADFFISLPVTDFLRLTRLTVVTRVSDDVVMADVTDFLSGWKGVATETGI